MTKDFIHIIIINYNGWQDTIECIESLLKSDFNKFQITLLDNGSSNDSKEELLKYIESISTKLVTSHIILKNGNFKNKRSTFLEGECTFHSNEIIFIESIDNLGFAGGNNAAINYIFKSDSDLPELNKYIFLLNPDTIVQPDTLSMIVKVKDLEFIASMEVRNYFAQSEVISSGGFKINKPFGYFKSTNNQKDIDYVYGGALVTNIRTIQNIGLLPSEYFLYWEETDYCRRARLKGIPLILIEDTYISDKVGQSTGRGKLAHYYFIRNSFIFYKKYFPCFTPTLFIFNIIRLLSKATKGELSAAKGILLGFKDFILQKNGHKNFN